MATMIKVYESDGKIIKTELVQYDRTYMIPIPEWLTPDDIEKKCVVADGKLVYKGKKKDIGLTKEQKEEKKEQEKIRKEQESEKK